MEKKIFKGFKQVTRAQFDAEENKAGYLWFVRTAPEATPSVIDEGEEGEEIKANDEYDIYFGSKQYGHFCEGELQSIKDRITALEGNVDEILTTLTDFAAIHEAQNNAITANTQSINALAEELSKHLIKNVDSNDKVLNVADGILSSSIELVYEDTHIKLFGKSKEVTETDESGNTVTKTVREELGSINASVFIKDSVLDNVEVVEENDEKYLEFTWKVETEGGEAKVDRIKISDFAKLYSAGTALELTEDDKFNVKVAANDNFLSVNDNNELIVDDVTTDKTMIKEDITIEGGPLASDGVKAAFEGGVIPAGTDIQTVLKALLCVEIYPDTTKNTPKYNVKVTTPSISASAGTTTIKTGALVEVGQSITFASLTAGAVSIYEQVNPTISGLEHGYSDVVSGGTIITASTISTEWDINQMSGQVYQLESSITKGFSGQTDNLPSVVQASASTSCVLGSCTLVADLGDNTYKVVEDAPKFVGSHDAISEVYVVSNLGGRSEDKKSVSFEASGDVEKDANDDKNSTNSRTFTVTGVYPVYSNIKSNAFTESADTRFGLQTGKTFTIEAVPTEVGSAYNFMFDFPATNSISSFKVKDLQGNWVDFSAFYEIQEETIEKTIQGTKYDYKRLTTGGGNGDGSYQITLTNALNA